MIGTLAYMPPEQALGELKRVDQRSDVFGLGGILCAILTGEPPYALQNREMLRVTAMRGELDDAYTRLERSGAERGLIMLAKRCLSFDPGKRPADAGILAAEVAKLRADAEAGYRAAELERARAEVKEAEQRKRRRMQWGLVSVILLLLGIDIHCCPQCGQRTLQCSLLPPQHDHTPSAPTAPTTDVPGLDSS